MKRRDFLIWSGAAPLAALAGSAAQTATPSPGVSRIDAAELQALASPPGGAIGLVRGDGPAAFAMAGAEALDRPDPVTRSTVFQIASLTKPFTAIVILSLVEDGRLGLEDPVRRWVAWLPDAYQAVTVRRLLDHTSGVPRDLRRENVDEFDMAEFRKRFLAAKPDFAPGAKWEYANTGYILLTLVAEAAARKPFGRLLEERIFRPLGMRRTRYRAPLTPGRGRAAGYDWQDAWRPAARVYSGFGNSGIESTIEDLVLFARALHRRRLLNEASYRQMLSPATLASGAPLAFDFRGRPSSYGLGWFLTAFCGEKVVTHGGVIAGFSSQLYWVPGRDLSVAALANAKSGPDRIGVAEKLAAPRLRTALACAA